MKLKPKTPFTELPETQFRLAVSLFLAQHQAMSFHQDVISACDHFTMAQKTLGHEKANRIAAKNLKALSESARKQFDEANESNRNLMAALGMHLD